jgi:hypothetical protein
VIIVCDDDHIVRGGPHIKLDLVYASTDRALKRIDCIFWTSK